MAIVGAFFVHLFCIVIFPFSHLPRLLLSKWPKRKSAAAPPAHALAKLPPGSMGWPYIGETSQLYSQDPNIFFAKKQKRYGEIFKTRVLGCPCVMLASPEAAHFVLVTHADVFRPTYPPSKMRMIGPSALFFHHGSYHLRLRRLVQAALGVDVLRRIMPDVESAVADVLSSWEGRVSSTFDQMKTLAFNVGILMIFGDRLEGRRKAELKRNYAVLERGYNAFPNPLHRSAYQNAAQARKRLQDVLTDIIKEKRNGAAAASPTGNTGLLEILVNTKDVDSGGRLTDEQIADNVIGVLFAAQDTTASALTWIIKYLHDDQSILDAVKSEQMAIYKTNERRKSPLTWAQTRSMTLTHKVILEGLRMASIISFTYREAVVDVEYKGFLIPKGWKVMPLFRNIHHSSDFFANPHKFDPSRFEVGPKTRTFIPFGKGVHACPGNEVAKLQMLIAVHYLLTRYRLEVVGGGEGVEHRPFIVPKDGLPATLHRQVMDDSTISVG